MNNIHRNRFFLGNYNILKNKNYNKDILKILSIFNLFI